MSVCDVFTTVPTLDCFKWAIQKSGESTWLRFLHLKHEIVFKFVVDLKREQISNSQIKTDRCCWRSITRAKSKRYRPAYRVCDVKYIYIFYNAKRKRYCSSHLFYWIVRKVFAVVGSRGVRTVRSQRLSAFSDVYRSYRLRKIFKFRRLKLKIFPRKSSQPVENVRASREKSARKKKKKIAVREPVGSSAIGVHNIIAIYLTSYSRLVFATT